MRVLVRCSTRDVASRIACKPRDQKHAHTSFRASCAVPLMLRLLWRRTMPSNFEMHSTPWFKAKAGLNPLTAWHHPTPCLCALLMEGCWKASLWLSDIASCNGRGMISASRGVARDHGLQRSNSTGGRGQCRGCGCRYLLTTVCMFNSVLHISYCMAASQVNSQAAC